jgi:hypothetical protein
MVMTMMGIREVRMGMSKRFMAVWVRMFNAGLDSFMLLVLMMFICVKRRVRSTQCVSGCPESNLVSCANSRSTLPSSFFVMRRRSVSAPDTAHRMLCILQGWVVAQSCVDILGRGSPTPAARYGWLLGFKR